MKKLMIAFAAIAMACAANAASTMLWGGYAYSGDPESMDSYFTGGQAYLLLLADSTTYTTMDDLIAAGTVVDSVDIIEGVIGTKQIDDSDSVFGTSGTKYLAILATTDGAAGEAGIPTSGLYGIYQGEMEYTAGAGGGFSVPDDFEGWGAINVNQSVGGGVPEPTSGLLLLLGMAGLALKRKIA